MPSYDITPFIDFMRARGLAPARSGDIIADDRVRRFTIAGDKPKSLNGSYRLGHIDGALMGWARSHKEGVSHSFRHGETREISPEESARIKREADTRRAAAAKARHDAQVKVSHQAQDIWQGADILFGPHPYTARKNIDWKGMRKDGFDLVLPLHDVEKKIWNIQRILPARDAAGNDKYFLPGGRIIGCYHAIGRINPARFDPFIFCEGYATGKTLSRIFGWPVVCAIQANNLPNVASVMRKKYADRNFIFAADHDRWSAKQDGTPWNAGVHYALSAARSTGGSVQTLPERLGQHDSRPTDFNDMAAIEGDEAVRETFRKGVLA